MSEIIKSHDTISTDAYPRGPRSNRRSPPPSRPMHHRRSRSRSPNHNQSASSSNHDNTGRYSRSSDHSFRTPDSKSTSLSACAICLGRHRHIIGKCNNPTIWSGQPSLCRRNNLGRIINAKGTVLCVDWQKPNGCSSISHDHKHECSGCGNTSHGAQKCPRAEKAQGPHTTETSGLVYPNTRTSLIRYALALTLVSCLSYRPTLRLITSLYYSFHMYLKKLLTMNLVVAVTLAPFPRPKLKHW
jgi:hypothetical protein